MDIVHDASACPAACSMQQESIPEEHVAVSWVGLSNRLASCLHKIWVVSWLRLVSISMAIGHKSGMGPQRSSWLLNCILSNCTAHMLAQERSVARCINTPRQISAHLERQTCGDQVTDQCSQYHQHQHIPGRHKYTSAASRRILLGAASYQGCPIRWPRLSMIG